MVLLQKVQRHIQPKGESCKDQIHATVTAIREHGHVRPSGVYSHAETIKALIETTQTYMPTFHAQYNNARALHVLCATTDISAVTDLIAGAYESQRGPELQQQRKAAEYRKIIQEHERLRGQRGKPTGRHIYGRGFDRPRQDSTPY